MIICKSKTEIDIMREAGRIVALTHKELKKAIRPGITTGDLDEIAEAFIRKHGAKPSFKGYGGFAGSICTSVNEELVHGIPGKRKLKEGDIISLDIGAEVDGYHGDSAWTYAVGKISPENQRLLDVTEKSLYEGLAQAKPDARLTDISHAIQVYVEAAGYSIVREYVGHGIGRSLHEDPQIPNFGPPGRGPRLKPGMVLAIEPMVNAGKRYVRTLADNWTVVTVDGSMCAHFEHTIAITEDGYEILTKE
ncbi:MULTISPECIES: type I methionyl aminopeptidase [Aneurinibacillus]|uniref:Methionine aminopeptidase n=1 Tax=Aneurinibacillus thermoaerophilus TaxID=143495 RepID=A0A1G8C4K1_ANETH|nr:MULTISPECIES: type I methionyl aminopeptidase [Aneurinibacillus]AMA74405.1 methionine aminopeptidase [Aneurinibacillus sp. XH2]MED0674492.1 type I methionyl aminopeptidase [Aneurinibacillus thermoaerophilus]MED0679202.1 type I methionyl aminopeptidase [Aneurinibacillus thermoaerophilus]MED0738200.1 type I methionyl aminopeptidase [Aneurinibacillus thermoaerophilus]MED0757511.1 type I methionyl aminopeptidase [Aneurinibacillus thermoaerophilus]